MGIKFTPKFNVNDLLKQVKDDVESIETDILERFQMVGDEFVQIARDIETYKDRTNNLRSSIGYIVFKDGKPVDENFEQTGSGKGNGNEGLEKGRKIANDFEDLPQKGYCLVCVAGMGYAAAVESKGFDVISGSTLKAEKLLKESLDRLKKKL